MLVELVLVPSQRNIDPAVPVQSIVDDQQLVDIDDVELHWVDLTQQEVSSWCVYMVRVHGVRGWCVCLGCGGGGWGGGLAGRWGRSH